MTEPTPRPVVRILLLDDHALFRQSLLAVLAARPDFLVVGEAGTSVRALALAEETVPDVLLLDIELKDENGLCFLLRVRERYPRIRVLVVSMHNKANFVQRANAAGAYGYVLKDESPAFLLSAVERVHAGERVHTSGLDWSELAWNLLTERERQVARLLAKGFSNLQIAATLGVGERGIETHRAHVREKLGLSSAVEIAHYIRTHGIFECDEQ